MVNRLLRPGIIPIARNRYLKPFPNEPLRLQRRAGARVPRRGEQDFAAGGRHLQEGSRGAGVASTDVFSEEYVQFVVGGTGSQVIITACDSDADANSSTTFIQYNSKPRVAIPANAQGTGSVTARR